MASWFGGIGIEKSKIFEIQKFRSQKKMQNKFLFIKSLANVSNDFFWPGK